METTPHTSPFSNPHQPNNDLAAEVIRKKIKSMYAKSSKIPKKLGRPADTPTVHQPAVSAHRHYRNQLSQSGLPMAEVQTAWHNYYVNLPDDQKHEVWKEFYEQSSQDKANAQDKTPTKPKPKSNAKAKLSDNRTVGHIKQQILSQVSAQGKLKAKHHLQSILFGLAMGSVVLLVFLFGFFNERIIAPFITPSRTVSNTPIITTAGTTVSGGPEVIIPKINVEIPVIYGMDTVEESAVETALESGVVHYATTPAPGEKGNVVIFGHSSNNILNKGKYKFAFVLLHQLQIGDTFMLTKDGKRYTYQIYKRDVVEPTQVSVLGPADRPSTATLITCDPPGTSLKRLVVVGEQISPDPGLNTKSSVDPSVQTATTIPSNSPTLWSRITGWFH